MTYSMAWLADVLRAARLNVEETKGWQTRGHGDMGKVLGILCHHTSGPATGNMKDLQVIIDGRPDLPGPLSQLALGRDGTFYVVAAGVGWHAGRGEWHGVTNGNSHMIGIEAENTGLSDRTGKPLDPWPDVQMDAYARGCAAILRHVGADPAMCAGHKEYALPKGRKDDPNFDMGAFRARVAALMGTMPEPAAPAMRDGVANTNDLALRSRASASSPLVRRLRRGDAVKIIREVMNDTTKWYEVQGGGFVATGFVAARYVDLK